MRRNILEEASLNLEKFQKLTYCMQSEKEGQEKRPELYWSLSSAPAGEVHEASLEEKVAGIREEGSIADTEMSVASSAAGSEPWVLVSILLTRAMGFRLYPC